MIQYTIATSSQHLQGILDLQKRNLASNLDESEVRSQGFVTVRHSIGDLQMMNDMERHVIAVDDGRVVAYLLAMTPSSKNDIPVLIPMFDAIESIVYRGKPLAATSYIVVGQACVDKSYRGQGVFDEIYRFYRECFRARYPYVITEIDEANTRSLRAHQRVGFETIKEYTAPNGILWHIVLWDWA